MFSFFGFGFQSREKMVVIGKAGRARHMGTRPTVRGSAMNPVDHPYGGGEGRQMRGLKRPKNAWGKGTRESKLDVERLGQMCL